MATVEESAKFVRLREGGIGISRNYVRAWNKDPKEVIGNICKIFYVRPHFTSKGEVIFDSGVLRELFSKVIKNDGRHLRKVRP